ncbi:MAG: DUF4962 domain-containing protein [Candidatus Hinthialibacter antarcticus]|nr:DUF4962 domain-containing protein [Candidatus Hinthialibacter antarcticus]
MKNIWILCSIIAIFAITGIAAPSIDETPAQEREWGFRPVDRDHLQLNPPSFSWRPQRGAETYELQCSSDLSFQTIEYQIDDWTFNVHTPPTPFKPGAWHWRFRYISHDNVVSEWSRMRTFSISEDATEFSLPSRNELIARIPKQHPRLFVRPEQIENYKQRAQTDLKEHFNALVKQCEAIMKNPPSTDEPKRYPDDIERKSEEWRALWWGNRTYTIKALNSAATLAFTRLVGGKEEYGEMAKRILLDCAKWDPKGSTGYRYNDEAGMPYNYYFSRTYTFVNDLLNEEEKQFCREVMRVRGQEMSEHLNPRHLWQPYASHSNRAWHFLGEVGIAFLDEIPEAEDWVWFAANVFSNVYPVWSDSDGGWHEGSSYWNSYMGRFTWWADVMRVAMDLDAFEKPFFSQAGYYPMYLAPPGAKDGGFGDLTANRRSDHYVNLVSIFAAQAKNSYWQWYVDQHGGASFDNSYIGFIRGALPKVEAKAPSELPASRCFWGTGQAMLNSDLLNAKDNVQVVFKSSPFGTQSHGYESQNSFLLNVFGERMFIRTGKRDIYGSDHHQNWMWDSKSTNTITVNGQGQKKHSGSAVGEILEFYTSDKVDYVAGEASAAYEGKLERFTRRIIYLKPDAVLIYDTLDAPEPSSFEWRLHAVDEMKIENQHNILAKNGDVECRVDFLWPNDLALSQTNKFDPPPRERVKLTEYHLTAETKSKSKRQEFITLFQPYRKNGPQKYEASIQAGENGYSITLDNAEKPVSILLCPDSGQVVAKIGVQPARSVAQVGVHFGDETPIYFGK